MPADASFGRPGTLIKDFVQVYESPSSLLALQEIIERSAATAGPSIKRNFSSPDWRMSAEEFVQFWGEERMASISTVAGDGTVHVAPLGLRLVDGKFYVPTFADSQRLKDHRANPRCAISSWHGYYLAVIVYGIAREVSFDPTGRSTETAVEQGYEPGSVLTVEIMPSRIYGIRPPSGHPAAGDPSIMPTR